MKRGLIVWEEGGRQYHAYLGKKWVGTVYSQPLRTDDTGHVYVLPGREKTFETLEKAKETFEEDFFKYRGKK